MFKNRYLFLIFICSLFFASFSLAETPGNTLTELNPLGSIAADTILYGVNTPDGTPDGGKVVASTAKDYFNPAGFSQECQLIIILSS